MCLSSLCSCRSQKYEKYSSITINILALGNKYLGKRYYQLRECTAFSKNKIKYLSMINNIIETINIYWRKVRLQIFCLFLIHLISVVLYLPVYRLVPPHAGPILGTQVHQIKLKQQNVTWRKNKFTHLQLALYLPSG